MKKVATNTIDAGLLAKMFLAGAKNLEVKKEWINELNVFPVPDGDTGTNMTMTITAAAADVSKLDNPDMYTLGKCSSSGSLRGARGNSGVILSQFFRGISKSLKGKTECNAEELAVALKDGSDAAYKAVMKPTEGTILTVSREVATGAQLADALRTHIEHYPIEIFEDRKIEKAELQGKEKKVFSGGGETFTAPAVIIATGASWRKLNVEGEAEYLGRGVAFCPHCDGPFYQGKHVAVIGGENSGIEAAIDLAGICRKVTVFEFADTLKADQVLQEKAESLPNVEIFTSSQTTRVTGDGEKVTGIRIKDRITNEERDYPLDGIFVQIGLAANSAPFRDALETTPTGEIKTDAFCRTTLPGVYAAGDVSDVPYKQIVIAMGEGAKAALSAFDDRIRGIA